jgi:hypothetical protein
MSEATRPKSCDLQATWTALKAEDKGLFISYGGRLFCRLALKVGSKAGAQRPNRSPGSRSGREQ